ncbi:MAG: ribosomal protein methyltransferase [Solirubrobacteraceae bacterium]|nr:ribosomal protein methyltransferase [Solirubrobacteraceae bacterium]
MIRLSVRVRGDDQGVVLAELMELSPAGVEEVATADGVEYVIYGAPGELPALPALRAAAGDVLVDVSSEEIADDWDERWKQWHRPVDVGHLRIIPPWISPRPPDIIIDPGQAFGTGGHATTRLCLELLLTLEPGGPLADWGCGSGVLAIAAAKLGFDPVVAVDYDPLAVEATRANARVNGVALEVARHNLREAPGPSAPTVCANLLKPLLLEVARLAEPPRNLIVSGLLDHEADAVVAAFGLPLRDRRDAEGWAALLLG